ncbi:MAG: hypothetical protein AAGF47_01805 [Planctomycetota bacterium]
MQTPRTDDELHEFVRERLGVSMPRPPIGTTGPDPSVHGHTGVGAPFAYLCHAFFEDRLPRDAVVWANRGGGKTFLGAVATALDLLFKPGVEVRIVAGSLEQAGRMHEHLRGIFERDGFAELVQGRMTDKRLRLTNGSRAELLAASQAAIRGTRVQKVRCDEAELFPPALWQAAQLVTRSTTLGGQRVRGGIECLSTMHRPFGLMRDLVAEAGTGTRTLFRWGVTDVLAECPDPEPDSDGAQHGFACNEGRPDQCVLWEDCGGRAKRHPPGQAGHIDVEDAMAMKRRVSLPVWQAEMRSLRPRRTDAVYPAFDRAEHVRDLTPPIGGRWIGGMDFGFRSPTAMLLAHLDDQGVLRVMHERIEREAVVADHAAWLTHPDRPSLEFIGVDPAGHQRSAQTGDSDIAVLKSAGLTVRSRPSGIRHGIGLVTARLSPASGPPRLLIHPRCAGLIEALERYHYPEDKPDATEPAKDGPDHAADALRYMIINLDDPFRSERSRWA